MSFLKIGKILCNQTKGLFKSTKAVKNIEKSIKPTCRTLFDRPYNNMNTTTIDFFDKSSKIKQIVETRTDSGKLTKLVIKNANGADFEIKAICDKLGFTNKFTKNFTIGNSKTAEKAKSLIANG